MRYLLLVQLDDDETLNLWQDNLYQAAFSGRLIYESPFVRRVVVYDTTYNPHQLVKEWAQASPKNPISPSERGTRG